MNAMRACMKACIHWRRLVKSIGWANPNFLGKMCQKLLNAWAFPDFLGGARPGCPQSLRICMHTPQEQFYSLYGYRFKYVANQGYEYNASCDPSEEILIDLALLLESYNTTTCI